VDLLADEVFEALTGFAVLTLEPGGVAEQHVDFVVDPVDFVLVALEHEEVRLANVVLQLLALQKELDAAVLEQLVYDVLAGVVKPPQALPPHLVLGLLGRRQLATLEHQASLPTLADLFDPEVFAQKLDELQVVLDQRHVQQTLAFVVPQLAYIGLARCVCFPLLRPALHPVFDEFNQFVQFLVPALLDQVEYGFVVRFGLCQRHTFDARQHAVPLFGFGHEFVATSDVKSVLFDEVHLLLDGLDE